MASRSEKLRRRKNRKEKKQRRGWGPVAAPDYEQIGAPLVVNAPGAAKMSAALLELVEPEWDPYADEAKLNDLLTLGIVAWNAALEDGAERRAFLEEMAEALPVEFRQDFKHAVEPYIRRKEALFPHEHRQIISFELTQSSPGKASVSVLSAVV